MQGRAAEMLSESSYLSLILRHVDRVFWLGVVVRGSDFAEGCMSWDVVPGREL